MLHNMSNMASWGNALEDVITRLTAWLPPGWEVSPSDPRRARHETQIAGVLDLTAPDGTVARIIVVVKDRFTAAQAANSGLRLRRIASDLGADSALVVAGYLSELARTRLREQNIPYIDETGNAWLTLRQPAVWVEARGANKDPNPPKRRVRSLKGGKAGRIIRALCDWRTPVGVRELAGRAGVDPGYTTRVLTLLADEDVIRRSKNGGIAAVMVSDLLQRWARDYRVRTSAYLAPRGTDYVLRSLGSLHGRYALTGSHAVPSEAAVAPARLLRCYVENADVAAKRMDLTKAEIGANVLLLQPPDPVVFERTRREKGVVLVGLSQCAVDLLTGSGREPNEGESLLNWMERNENVWRD
jgi:hypothetical protein